MSKLSDKIGQFATIPETVIAQWNEIGNEGMLVFIYLRYRTNRERGTAYPSYDRIQNDTGMHPRAISRGIKALEKANLLERKKRFGKPTIYVLKLPDPPDMGGDSSSSVEETHARSTQDGVPSSSRVEAQSFQSGSTVLPTVEEKPDREVLDREEPEDEEEARARARRKLSKEEAADIHRAITRRFCGLTGIREPTRSADWKDDWLAPVGELCALVDFDEEKALDLMEKAVERNRSKGLSISRPKSVLNSARATIAEERLGKAHQGESDVHPGWRYLVEQYDYEGAAEGSSD